MKSFVNDLNNSANPSLSKYQSICSTFLSSKFKLLNAQFLISSASKLETFSKLLRRKSTSNSFFEIPSLNFLKFELKLAISSLTFRNCSSTLDW
ncbi:Uncharacterised protein, partial [Mycoplasmopsis synoviae]